MLRSFFLALVAAICFAVDAYAVALNKSTGLDHFANSIQSMESPAMTTIMKIFTFIGSPEVVLILFVISAFVLYKVLHHRTEVVLFAAVMVGTVVVNQVLKTLFHRARPDIQQIVTETGYSFPSFHSMGSFALFGVLTFLLWRHIKTSAGRTMMIIGGVLLTLLVGISRIYLGVHYVSDVVGGYLASGFWLGCCIYVFQRYQERKFNTSNKTISVR
jgi:undecaprenyl-diphosphatase